ncbi:hypothetical protein CEXT_401141 [Caerostris extrusa]|uniref:Uncharacterized protein n=1 Tax=Caerostris extrusa TaxID=172846 RepID=A0AAV4Q0D7_CAEEX|nr:hypothetical protein CEXT_401141 [Caerostris extrusa]
MSRRETSSEAVGWRKRGAEIVVVKMRNATKMDEFIDFIEYYVKEIKIENKYIKLILITSKVLTHVENFELWTLKTSLEIWVSCEICKYLIYHLNLVP